jgi:glycosyltransferase involved in cell wall biosynthesis
MGSPAAVRAVIPVGYTGFFHDPTGFGSAAIVHAKALAAADVPLRIRSVRLDGPGIAPSRPRVRIASEPTTREPTTHILHVPTPHLGSVTPAKGHKIGFVAWETERAPASFLEQVWAVDELWVPSAFSARPFSATRKPMHVIPHPVLAERRPRAPFPRVPDDVFLFASIFEWSDRKNPLGLLRAFRAAFNSADVGLLLKIGLRFGANAPKVLSTIADTWGRPRPGRTPPLWVILEDLSEHAIARIHQRADAYVSLHHAEGFGLCLAQAMATGRPVVATGYSGNLEFMDERSAFFVDYDIVPIKQELAPYPFFEPTMQWAEPRRESAVAALRACAFNAGQRSAIAATGFERVREELSPALIGRRMRARVAD